MGDMRTDSLQEAAAAASCQSFGRGLGALLSFAHIPYTSSLGLNPAFQTKPSIVKQKQCPVGILGVPEETFTFQSSQPWYLLVLRNQPMSAMSRQSCALLP